MSKFDTEATTLKYLTDRKKPTCVEALSELFHSARKEGLGLREAYWYAETIHFLRDHEGHLHEPKLTFDATDEAARQTIVDVLLGSGDLDGKAEDRVDTVIKWYDLFRSWGAGVGLAFTSSVKAGQEEWETANDISEAEAVAALNAVTTDGSEEGESVKQVLFSVFYAERKAGNSVTASLRAARDEAEEILALHALFSGTGLGLTGRSYLGSKGSGYVN